MAGLYIHIPFCRSKCGYCDFHSTPRIALADDYLRALESEARQRLNRDFNTVYIGGGTPSALSLPQLELLFSLPGVNCERVEEWTIEVNPDDVTHDFARFIANSPVNRVSMGVQSLVDGELATACRRHNASEAVDAFYRLRDAGIDNMSLDLIYGLPGQTLDSWQHSLDRMMQLRPEHLSAYMLSYEPGTKFSAMLQAGKLRETPEDILIEMYDRLCRAAKDAGYIHYEISNFALPGRRSRHNSSYWTGEDYVGLGTGAHSLVDNERYFNSLDIKAYISASGRDFLTAEHLTVTERINDTIITRLRTIEGLDLNEFGARFGESASQRLLNDAGPGLERGQLVLSGGSLQIPESQWLMTDAILLSLIL